MPLQESGEMYLETIYVLSKTGKPVRAVDVGEHMGFSKPSVSRAIGLLRSGGYILVSKEGYITLTDIGREVAMKVYSRHTIITELLVSLGVSRDVAVSDACRIEHCISDESFEAIKKYTEGKIG